MRVECEQEDVAETVEYKDDLYLLASIYSMKGVEW